MKRIKVNSTLLEAVGYEPKNKTLEIEFKNGSIYLYYDVEPMLHYNLMLADSTGKYYNRYIKGKRGTRIDENKNELGKLDLEDIFWVFDYKGAFVDARNTEPAARSVAELNASKTPGMKYFVTKIIGSVAVPPQDAVWS